MECKELSVSKEQTLNIGRHIRLAIFRWHCVIARTEFATRLYFLMLATLVRLVPSRRIRGVAEWAVIGQSVPWKPLAFAPRTVVVGNRTSIKLTPHLGEFDQAALFRRRLD